jgi:predicted lipoprotein with Yx(FWY)xxD motif
VNRKTYAIAIALMGALAALIAGCGSSSNGGAYGGGETSSGTTNSSSGGSYGGKSGSSNSTSTAGSGGGVGVVAVAKVGDLGPVIVNSEGLTLYDFHKDKGGVSSCYGACAGAWPPLLSEGEPKAEAGAMSNQLGTTKRKDGTIQVTYNGWPLYTYVGDQGPGEANGNDFSQFGAQWYALMPNGEEPED